MFVNKRFTKLVKLILAITGLIGLVYIISEFLDNGSASAIASRLSQETMDGFRKKYESFNGGSPLSILGSSKSDIRTEADILKLKDFYGTIFNLLKDYSPPGKSAREYDANCGLEGDTSARDDATPIWGRLSFDKLSGCLKVSSQEQQLLKNSHKLYVDKINQQVLPKNSYKGRGIVTVGGGKFSLMATSMINAIRKTGTTLPIEVFIPPADQGQEDFYCNTWLPKYNAKCIYITDILSEKMIESFTFEGYQFKSLALITSSFEDILLLDADNIPLQPLDKIFDSDIYKSAGLILWPDFWRRTTMPLFYEIAGMPYNKNKRVRNNFDDITPPEVYTKDMTDFSDVPFHDMEGTLPDPSTESGQLLISKGKHIPTLLLSLYYNVNGPSWYYPIFSQRAAGEGDKETFIAAAQYYALSYYQVKTLPGVDGYFRSDNNEFRGVGILQHNFIQDNAYYMQLFQHSNEKYNAIRQSGKRIPYDKDYSMSSVFNEFFSTKKPDSNEYTPNAGVMFVHCNLPKFDPLVSWENNDLIENGKHIRSFRNKKIISKYDIELENYKLFKENLCPYETGKGSFSYLDKKLSPEDWASMCKYIEDRCEYLESTHEESISN